MKKKLVLWLFQQLAAALLLVASQTLAARLDNTYLPPGSAGSAGGTGLQAPNKGFGGGGGGFGGEL